MKGLKNNKAVGNDGIPSEVYKFASERLLTMMSLFLYGCMLTVLWTADSQFGFKQAHGTEMAILH